VLNPNLVVLVVDDMDTVRKLICEILHELGCKHVEEATNSSAALNSLRRRRADLILLDWSLPQTSGLELLQTIRREEEFKDIPVIMVTGKAEKADIITAMQHGVNDYIIKPFSAVTFEKKINKIFGLQ
jgi:two-component system chemotaxis response regulator CheY